MREEGGGVDRTVMYVNLPSQAGVKNSFETFPSVKRIYSVDEFPAFDWETPNPMTDSGARSGLQLAIYKRNLSHNTESNTHKNLVLSNYTTVNVSTNSNKLEILKCRKIYRRQNDGSQPSFLGAINCCMLYVRCRDCQIINVNVNRSRPGPYSDCRGQVEVIYAHARAGTGHVRGLPEPTCLYPPPPSSQPSFVNALFDSAPANRPGPSYCVRGAGKFCGTHGTIMSQY
ncbi:hypothetical protein J6590_046714 [Homalodisca vitripennis]|nr:hypothetical protein J6590_046714 [Homalodisca vitripennis]